MLPLDLGVSRENQPAVSGADPRAEQAFVGGWGVRRVVEQPFESECFRFLLSLALAELFFGLIRCESRVFVVYVASR